MTQLSDGVNSMYYRKWSNVRGLDGGYTPIFLFTPINNTVINRGWKMRRKRIEKALRLARQQGEWGKEAVKGRAEGTGREKAWAAGGGGSWQSPGAHLKVILIISWHISQRRSIWLYCRGRGGGGGCRKGERQGRSRGRKFTAPSVW